MRDVFNPSDFDTEKKVWDKKMRSEFIQRLIDQTARRGVPVVGCVAAKTIAGIEPNKTNELLQALARLAQAKLSGQDAPVGRPRTFTRNSVSSINAQKPTRNVQTKQASKDSTQLTQPTVGKISPSDTRVKSGELSARASKRSSLASTGTNSADRRASDRNKESQATNALNITPSPPKFSPPLMHLEPIEDRKIQAPELVTTEPRLKVPPGNKRQPLVVTSESDINKHLPQLKTNLKHLRTVMSELGQLDEQLQLVFKNS